MIRQDLAQFDLPGNPGVYFFRDSEGKILYIGKATSLKDRVRSYFGVDLIKSRGPRLVDMVFKASSITWQETNSVLEALILEANLIKKYQPYYNKQEKDDKSFNCVAITKEDFPRILLVRQKDIDTREKLITLPKQKGIRIRYDAVFGPYPSGSSLREALAIIRRIFPYRDRVSAMKDKEAFYRQIELSPDITNDAAAKVYRKNIGHIKKIFQGKLQTLIKDLTKEMNALAKQERFEEASELKQKIFALTHVQDVSLIKRDLIQSTDDNVVRFEAYDIAHLSGKQMVGVMVVVANATAQKNDYRKFIVRGFDRANDAGALREVLVRRLAYTEWKYPTAIIVDGNEIQANAARKVLESLGLTIPIIAVTKDERHRPKAIHGPTELVEAHKFAILLANNEAHRYAINFHKDRRRKAML
jgi:excinuclease ABC subunit C